MFVTTIKFLLIYSLECKGVKFRIINPRMNQLPTLLYTCLSKDLNWKKREVLLECIHPPCRRSSDVEFFQIKKSHRCAGMSKILVGTNLCAGRNLTPLNPLIGLGLITTQDCTVVEFSTRPQFLIISHYF